MAKEKPEPDAEFNEDDFELISSPRQLAKAPDLHKEKVFLTTDEWPTTNGKGSIFLAWELSGSGYSEFLDSGWVYKEGIRHHYDPIDEDIRWLAHTLRDAGGNRLWQTTEAAKNELGQVGRATQLKLIAAVNRMNSGNSTARAEGNSEKTQTAA